MTQIILSAPQYFRAGQGGVSAVVGVESTLNRVARYSFVAPAGGASEISFAISGLVFGEGTRPQSLGLFLGTDPESHKNAGAGSQTTAVLSPNGDYTAYQGAAGLLLLPGQRYYLFLFPLTATYGWFSLELAQTSLGLSGGSASVPSLSAESLALGQTLTIQTNRHSSRFTHRLTYQFAGLTGQVADGVGESCRWTPPLSLAEAIPSGLRGSCTLTCTTYEDSRVIGSTSVSLVLTVPESVVPTVTLALGDGPWVQNVSRLEPQVQAQGAWGSTITAQSLQLGGQSYTGAVLKTAGENQLTVTVTDSRGRSAAASLRFTVIAYEPPALSLTAHRCDSDGSPNDGGEFCRVTLTGCLWAQSATLTTAWGESLALEKGDFSHSVILPAPSEQSLSLWAAVADQYLTTRRELTLSVGYATLDLLAGGRGIAFGTTATEEGFTCAMDARFTGGLFLGDGQWLFPPLEPGVEYPTAQRFRSKPVFVKLVESQTLPNAGWQYLNYAPGGTTEVVDFSAVVRRKSDGFTRSLPFFNNSGGCEVVVGINPASGNVELRTLYDFSGFSGTVVVRYIKK